MQVNVKSALYGVQAVAPAPAPQGAGGIVIYNPTPRETAEFVASEAVYTAAAHALSALAAGWTRQLEGSGVGVREVAPSPDSDTAETSTSRAGPPMTPCWSPPSARRCPRRWLALSR